MIKKIGQIKSFLNKFKQNGQLKLSFTLNILYLVFKTPKPHLTVDI